MTINYKLLIEHGAGIDEKTDAFFKRWGDTNVEVNRANINIAVDIGLDIHWLANQFLPPEQLARYTKAMEPAMERHRKAIVPIEKQYMDEIHLERKRYLLCMEAGAEFKPLKFSSLDRYNANIDRHLRIFNVEAAMVLVDIVEGESTNE